MNNKFILSLVVCVIAAGGLGFYGGMVYGKQQTPAAGAAGRGMAPGNFRGAAGRGANGGGFSNGEVVSKDATSLTLKLMDGGSKIILFSSSTRIGKVADGSLTDLAAGTNVMVTGATNTDGSVTASNIQIRPAGDFGGRGGRPGDQLPGQPAPQQP